MDQQQHGDPGQQDNQRMGTHFPQQGVRLVISVERMLDIPLFPVAFIVNANLSKVNHFDGFQTLWNSGFWSLYPWTLVQPLNHSLLLHTFKVDYQVQQWIGMGDELNQCHLLYRLLLHDVVAGNLG